MKNSPSKPKPGIFLSHTWSDKDLARRLAFDLEASGAKVWIDEAEIKLGDSLIEKIRSGIDSTDYLAVIISPASVKSEWVKKEVDIAMNQEIEGKRVKVLPLIYKECDLPGFLKGKLYADFTDPRKYDEALARILNRLDLAKPKKKHPSNLDSKLTSLENRTRSHRTSRILISTASIALLFLTAALFRYRLNAKNSLTQALGRTGKPLPSLAERLGGPPNAPQEPGTRWSGPLGLRFRFIPARVFQMGSPDSETGRYAEEALHSVSITSPFWIAETELTQEQWLEVTELNPSKYQDCGITCPVEMVNWYEAINFANALSEREGLLPCYTLEQCSGTMGRGCDIDNWWCIGDFLCESVDLAEITCNGYRIPTEAEWELAARSGSTGAIYSGELAILEQSNAPSLDPIAWYGGNSGIDYEGGYYCADWAGRQKQSDFCGTHPVGRKNENAWGLKDVIGNVFEWTQDSSTWDSNTKTVSTDTYKDNMTDPLCTTGTSRVVRGGGYGAFARRARLAARWAAPPSHRLSNTGIRLARTASPAEHKTEPSAQ